MSKIGRKPIAIQNVKVEVKGQEVHYQGKKASGVYAIPPQLTVQLQDKQLLIAPAPRAHGDINRIWGLHRALLANKIKGAETPFEKVMLINGLGYKAVVSGQKVVFTLGYSHKIDFELPKEVTLEVDKTGQKLTFRSSDRSLIGHVCGMVKALREPEPYKGTGIKEENEVIARKAGKTKAA